jgi:hypothetical protein
MILKLNIIFVYPNYECTFLYLDTSANMFHKDARMYKFEITDHALNVAIMPSTQVVTSYTFI